MFELSWLQDLGSLSAGAAAGMSLFIGVTRAQLRSINLALAELKVHMATSSEKVSAIGERVAKIEGVCASRRERCVDDWVSPEKTPNPNCTNCTKGL
jgi:hypothetical protein